MPKKTPPPEPHTLHIEFPRLLSDTEIAQIASAAQGAFARIEAPRTTRAHPVAWTPAWEEREDRNADGTVARFYRVDLSRPLTCGDCRRTLQAGNVPAAPFPFLVCSQVSSGLPAEDQPPDEHTYVACGVTD